MEAEQKQCKKIERSLDSLAAVIHKNERNAVGNSEMVVHPCFKLSVNLQYRRPGQPAALCPAVSCRSSVIAVKGVQKRVRTGRRIRESMAGGHPKSEITKLRFY